VSSLRSVWSWLSKTKNQKTLAIIGGGLAAVIGGAWQVYLHISEKSKEPSTVTAPGGGIVAGGNVSPTASTGGIAVVSTAPVTIGITLEQYEAGLKRKEQETRAELAQASAADKDKIGLLEKELTDVQAKLKNPEAALKEYKNKLAQAYRALDDLKQEIPLNQLEQAQQALAKGQSGDAEKLFQKVRSQGKEKAAEAAYQLAQLAYGRIDYAAAYQYFKEAAELQPDNPLYLNQAGLIAHTVGRYSEAEPLSQRARHLGEGPQPRPSRRGHEPQQPRVAVLRARPVCQGQAALPARARHSGEGPRSRPSRRSHEPQQPRGAVLRARPVCPGRAALPARARHSGEGPRPRPSQCGDEP
jgi:Flp pilus assembly protein TadD